jgi:hypothetical protein
MKGDDVPVSMLTDQVESYRLVQRLLRSFLDGKPEDVFLSKSRPSIASALSTPDPHRAYGRGS